MNSPVNDYGRLLPATNPTKLLAEIRRLLKRNNRPAVFRAMVAALLAKR